MKKCVIASDSFKGTLSSKEITEIFENEFERFFPDHNALVIANDYRYCPISGFSARHINDFTWLSDVETIIYPEKVEGTIPTIEEIESQVSNVIGIEDAAKLSIPIVKDAAELMIPNVKNASKSAYLKKQQKKKKD